MSLLRSQVLSPRVRRAFLFVSLSALAACADTGVAPRVDEGPTLPEDGVQLVANRSKYRDGGAPHATGRSGSATLVASAVIDANGVTHLTVVSGGLSDPGSGRGELEKVQVKGFALGGEKVFTQNHHRLNTGRATLQLGGLLPGDSVRVQANIKGIDRKRTDVVTVTALVRQAPSLRADLVLPREVPVGAPVLITATVSETGGDTGVRATCQLWVDGQLVDAAQEIWVDAGDAVTCAFTHTFTGAGDHEVEVRVIPTGGGVPVPPAKDDTSVVARTPNTATFRATAEDRTVTTSSRLDYQWSNPVTGSHKTYESFESNAERTQTVSLTGALDREVSFPLLEASFAMESAGTAWHEEDWTMLDALVGPDGRLCASRQVPQHAAVFYVCNGAGSATFGYTRLAGTVTYHSDGFIRTFDGLAGTTDVYSWNDTWTTQPFAQPKVWGQQVRIRVTVRDGAGAFGVTPVIDLADYAEPGPTEPYACTESSPYWLDGGILNMCTTRSVTVTGRKGEAEG